MIVKTKTEDLITIRNCWVLSHVDIFILLFVLIIFRLLQCFWILIALSCASFKVISYYSIFSSIVTCPTLSIMWLFKLDILLVLSFIVFLIFSLYSDIFSLSYVVCVHNYSDGSNFCSTEANTYSSGCIASLIDFYGNSSIWQISITPISWVLFTPSIEHLILLKTLIYLDRINGEYPSISYNAVQNSVPTFYITVTSKYSIDRLAEF